MHDLRAIRENPEAFDDGLRKRGLSPPAAAEILALDERRRAAIGEAQALQRRRNEASREIGALKSKGADASALMEEVAGIKERLQAIEDSERSLGEAIEARLAEIPNLPAGDVPEGPDETANRLVRAVGEAARRDHDREHFDIGEALGQMDFSTAARMSGARFVVLSGALARMERALAQYMLDLHADEFGYEEVSPPFLVRDNAVFGTGQLPKFAEDLFRTTDGYWLVPTAEVPLTNLAAEQILDAETLPRRYTAWTPCFRAEAGAAGRDTRGMIRQHQFSKVELVSITDPEGSEDEHERMTACAEAVLKGLGLPYRVMLLSTGDMGFAARKTYDLEVWLPGQGRYREISSLSNCGDFQARRMNARMRVPGEKGTRFVHTLNGSGLAVGRTLVAILENYQEPDATVTIPDALRRYMGGLERIAPKERT